MKFGPDGSMYVLDIGRLEVKGAKIVPVRNTGKICGWMRSRGESGSPISPSRSSLESSALPPGSSPGGMRRHDVVAPDAGDELAAVVGGRRDHAGIGWPNVVAVDKIDPSAAGNILIDGARADNQADSIPCAGP